MLDTFGKKLHIVYFAVRTELSVPLVLPRPTVSVRFPSSETFRPLQNKPMVTSSFGTCYNDNILTCVRIRACYNNEVMDKNKEESVSCLLS